MELYYEDGTDYMTFSTPMTFGTPWHLVHPDIWYPDNKSTDIWYTLTFGTPWQVVQYHLVHPDISYTLLPVRKGCTRCHGHLVHPFSKKPIRKGCTKCPWHLVHPFSNTPTGKGVPNVWVYQMSGCTKCPGIPNVGVYKMSGCTKCQGPKDYIERVYQMSMTFGTPFQ